MNLPAVIAVGQKSVRSEKSGHLFPAIHLQLPVPSLSDPSCISQVYKVWRVKRDFLQLNRAVQRYSKALEQTNRNGLPIFQKKAYNRLCDYILHNKPWEECRDNHSSDGDVGHSIEIKGDLHRLNLFIRDALRLVIHLRNTECHTCEGMALLDAWSEFSENQDTPGLIDSFSLPKHEYHGQSENPMSGDTTLKAASLGQYFASDKNGQRVVDYVIRYLFTTLRSSDQSPTSFTTIDLSNVLIIEPSCGNGIIINILIHTLEHIGISDNNMPNIIGYDIDPHVIATNKQNYTLKRNSYIFFRCCNFLLQTMENVNTDVLEIKRLREHLDCCESHQLDALAHLVKMNVIFLGGPPYTSGLGSGQRIDRDLPIQFIYHSIQCLGAEFVAFLLPLRCMKYIAKIQHSLNHNASSQENEKRYGTNISWSCTSIHLDDESLFYFQETEVLQPSVIQCWMISDRYKSSDPCKYNRLLSSIT